MCCSEGSLYGTYFLILESFVWIDETGSNKKDHIRKYGYALKGVTPVYHRLLCHGERYNAIAAVSCTDVLALEVSYKWHFVS